MSDNFEDLFGEPEESNHQINTTLEQTCHPCRPDLHQSDTEVIASYANLGFTKEYLATNPLIITVEKQPIRLQVGRLYHGQIVIDTNHQILGPLAAEAKDLRHLPPKVRARAVLKLLREKLKYAFPQDIKRLRMSNPEQADWIEQHTGLGNRAERVNLSDIFRNGYAICYHLAYAYLWLSQHADLVGVIIPVRDNDIINIQRSDTNEPLFKSVPVEAPVAGHVYAELLMPDGEWLAVDPSTNLISDTTEGQEIFRAARYQAFVTHELQTHTTDDRIGIHKTHALIPAMQASTAQAFQLHSPHQIQSLLRGADPSDQTTNVTFTIKVPAQHDTIKLQIVKVE